MPAYRMGHRTAVKSDQVTSEKNSMRMPDSMATTANCTQDSSMPLTSSEYRSMVMIWNAKASAHRMSRKSPRVMLNSPGLMDRRYRPMTAMTTLIQTRAGTRFFRKMPSIGTRTT